MAGVHIREGDHRGGRGIGGIEEQWVFVHEVAEGWFRTATAHVCFCGQAALRQAELLAEISDLGLLGFEVVVVGVSDDEIEKKKPGLDEFSRMFAAIGEGLFVDLRVKALREEMIDATAP